MAVIAIRDILWLGFLAIPFGSRVLPQSVRFRYINTLAKWIGTLWYRLDRSKAVLARKNLRAVFAYRLPGAELDATACAFFHNIVLGRLVNSMLPMFTLRDMHSFLSLEGVEHLETALSQGRGVVFLGAHFGLHSYAALMFLQRLGYQIACVTQEGVVGDEDTWFYRHVVSPIQFRCHFYMRAIARTGVPQREMADCLRQNHILMIMGDVLQEEYLRLQPPNVLPAPLLGYSLPLNTGPFRLARWLGAPVVPFFMAPRQSGFTVVIEPALQLSQENSTKGLLTDLAAFTARLEPYLLAYPALWWVHHPASYLVEEGRALEPHLASVWSPPA